MSVTENAPPAGAALGSVPLHPVLLALALVMGFWIDTTVSPAAVIRPVVVGVVLAATVTVAAALLLRNRHLAGVVGTAIILILYSKRLLFLVQDIGARVPGWLLGIWLILIGVVLVMILRLVLRRARAWRWVDTTVRLNVVTALLVLATLGSSLLDGGLVAAATADGAPASSPADISATESEEDPDIYVVLLDGYPRADVLAHAFDHDNTGFVDGLEDRGFSVATDSHSDYLWTHVSLSSVLHMRYVEQIDTLQPVIEGREPLHPAIRRTVNNNPAFEYLRERGYTVVTTASGYEELALRGGDMYLDGGQMNEFELKLLSSTFLGNVIGVVAPDLASGSHRDRITSGLRVLGEAATRARSGPQLVFAHVPAPHQPTVFGRNGEPVVVPLDERFYSDSPIERGADPDAWVVQYRDQLAYLNELILAAVDDIIAASPEPPVIVLWADHGSASQVDWVRTEMSEADPAQLLERTGTLFAALTPERESVYPDDITPVNLFRFLFDAYFDTDLGPADPPAEGGQIPPVDASVLEE